MKPALRAAAIALALWLPTLAAAAPSARQDFQEATRATPDWRNGARLFTACAACHGPDGGGRADDGIPRIAGQHPSVIISELISYRYGRRVDPRMQQVAARHVPKNAQETADVARYAASLRAGSPAVTGNGQYLEQGSAIYSARCASCHGPAGRGDEAALVPRLGGQHSRYLLRQLQDALEGSRPQLADSHARFLQDLDGNALAGMADLLSRAAGDEDPARP
jgi:predicted CxxxxCH...CXXCH cytochrome family protein